MPKYLNSNLTVATLGVERIEPGSTLTTGTFYPTLPAGVTLTSSTPVFTNVLASSKITQSGTYSVDSSITGNYQIRLYMDLTTNGYATYKLNDASSVADTIGPGDAREFRCSDRVVDNIIFTAVSGNVYLTIFAV